jgi:NADH-quinone oxidoreductase subunit D
VSYSETLITDLSTMEIGPFHPYLPMPMKLQIQTDGEVIAKVKIGTGLGYKGLEDHIARASWAQGVVYCDRLDPEAATFGEWAYVMAVEEIAEMEVPKRAKAIRILMAELTRISEHLLFLSEVAKTIQANTVSHFFCRDREKILDLFELLTGARFSLAYFRVGGVAHDISEGFLERAIELAEIVPHRVREYRELLLNNYVFKIRAKNVGNLDLFTIRNGGGSGCLARSAGVLLDERLYNQSLGYSQFDFRVPTTGRNGKSDVYSRVEVRIEEIYESAKIVRQIVEDIPSGPHRIDRTGRVPTGEAYKTLECARGLLGCHLISEGGEGPAFVQFSTPSMLNLDMLPKALEGQFLQDLALIVSSLDIRMAEVDR